MVTDNQIDRINRQLNKELREEHEQRDLDHVEEQKLAGSVHTCFWCKKNICG